MKYLLPACLIVFLFTGYPLHAQKKNKKDEAAVFYLFKQNWSLATNLDSAAYFMQIIKENDTTYLCRYYNKYGPMLKQESFKDEQLTTPNGVFLWYNKEGYFDSAGNVRSSRLADDALNVHPHLSPLQVVTGKIHWLPNGCQVCSAFVDVVTDKDSEEYFILAGTLLNTMDVYRDGLWL